MEDNFHKRLRKLIKEYVYLVYEVAKDFPNDERFGLTSQLKRSALSVMLNYIEGYARQRVAVNRNFLEISFGSLKESKFCTEFSWDHGYINEKEQYDRLVELADEIGTMMWSTISNIKN